jgi:hypothetical protein
MQNKIEIDLNTNYFDAIEYFKKIASEYSRNPSLMTMFLEVKKIIEKIQDKYLESLASYSRDDLLKEYEKGLGYLEEADIEYSKFIRAEPLNPGVPIEPIPFHELHAASDKIEIAERWLDGIRRYLY